MWRYLYNWITPGYMYGPLWNVKICKKTGKVYRLYREYRPASLRRGAIAVRKWVQVDGRTLRRLPNNRLAIVPKEERFMTAQSAL